MKKLERLSRESIIEEVGKDIKDRDESSLKLLQGFYFKIVTEPQIRTSSYRYVYARQALLTISEKLEDKDTISNLTAYHKDKVQFEIANPVTESDKEKTKVKGASPKGKFGFAVKTNEPSQFKM